MPPKGGLARRATFIRQMRESHKNVLILDAGNTLFAAQGLAQSSQGKVIIEAMNALGYKAMTLGSEDLRLGPTVLRERMKEAQFPLLSANVVISETGELFAQPYVILDVGQKKVGIVGLTEPLPSVPKVPGERQTLTARDPIEFGRPYVEKVIKEADLVILLSHMGQALDEALAAQVKGIDLIIGGRDRNVVPPSRLGADGPIISQMGSRGQLVGILELQMGEPGEITFTGKAQLLTSDYADDAAMVELLRKYR